LRIFVITKRTLIIAAIIFVCIVAAVIIALSFTEGNATAPTAAATVEEYELTVMAGRKKELPVYSVSRDDKKIALTIRYCCVSTQGNSFYRIGILIPFCLFN
jgi:hypothetical protein